MVDMPMRRTLLFERFVRLSTVLVVLLSLPVLGSAQTGQSPEALAKAQSYRADKPTAERFARDGKLSEVKVDYQ